MEDAQFASRVPNSHNFRPKQLDIYKTPPPDVEIRGFHNRSSEDSHDQPQGTEAGVSIVVPSPEVQRISSGDDSGIPISDTATPKSWNECDKYFPADAIPTKAVAPVDHSQGDTPNHNTPEKTLASTQAQHNAVMDSEKAGSYTETDI